MWAVDHLLVTSDGSTLVGEAARRGVGVSLGGDGRTRSLLVDALSRFELLVSDGMVGWTTNVSVGGGLRSICDSVVWSDLFAFDSAEASRDSSRIGVAMSDMSVLSWVWSG